MEKHSNHSISERIKTIRKKLGLNQTDFGNMIDEAHKGLVSRWESGINLPNNKRLKLIAELGGVSVNELLYGAIKDFSYNVLINEIDTQGALYGAMYQYMVDRGIITTNDTEQAKNKAIQLLNQKFKDIYMRMFMSYANSNEDIETIYDYPSKVIQIATNFFSTQNNQTDSFVEYHNKIDNLFNNVPLKKHKILGNENKQDKLDKYYTNELTHAIKDFQATLNKLYNDYTTDITSD